MPDLETTGWYALGIPAYVLVIAIEIAVTRRLGLRSYGFADTLSNLTTGMGALLVGLILAPGLLWLYDLGLSLAVVRWPEGSEWAQLPVALLLADLSYYAYHRAGHTFGALWAIHGVHHQAERFNMTVAMRMPWFADTYSFPFYAPLPLLGIDRAVFFTCIAIISFYALTVHSMAFHRPTLGVLVTPATHVVHHARNPRYVGRNLGAMFTIWDRLFGTHVEVVPEDPPRVGTAVGYRTHDPLRAQWILLEDLGRYALAAASWGDGARVAWARPGWRPSGVGALRDAPARSDDALLPSLRAYLVAQTAALGLLGTWVLWARDAHPVSFQVVGTLLTMWGLRTVGGLLDGRRGAWGEEAARILLTALALALATRWV